MKSSHMHYHTVLKMIHEICSFIGCLKLTINYVKANGAFAYTVDLHQTALKEQSNLGLHCFLIYTPP